MATFHERAKVCPGLSGLIAALLLGFAAGPFSAKAFELRADGYHVTPGEEIQPALNAAATNAAQKRVLVHAGTYFPMAKQQALIWLNERHDGIHLEAQGEVTLAATNSSIVGPETPGYPAAVNHVVYFGHRVGSNTLIKGFRIAGANGFCTKGATRRYEPDQTVTKGLFFFTDGGAIKIFGKSSPTLSDLVVEDNFTTPCAGGISIDQHENNREPVVIRNCVFRRNHAQVTGAAIDLLAGSSARIENCLFVGNDSNRGEDVVAKSSGETPFTNSGVITIFEKSRADVRRCTFTANRNAIDALSGDSRFENCIFYKNGLESGLPGTRYELDLPKGGIVLGCFIHGAVRHPALENLRKENVFDAADPQFNRSFEPANPAYQSAGYRAPK